MILSFSFWIIISFMVSGMENTVMSNSKRTTAHGAVCTTLEYVSLLLLFLGDLAGYASRIFDIKLYVSSKCQLNDR